MTTQRFQFSIGLGKDRHGKAIAYDEAIGRFGQTAKLAVELFGGGFISRGKGFWADSFDVMVAEAACVLSCDVTNPRGLSAADWKVRAEIFARKLAILWNQTEVHISEQWIGFTVVRPKYVDN